jgi:hypothetical protein
MLALTPTPPEGQQDPCAALLRRIRTHAEDKLAACPLIAPADIAARELKRAKPQLRNSAAQAMMQGTTAMLGVVEAWGDELAGRIAGEAARREVTLEQLVREHVDFSAAEVAAFAEASCAEADAERKAAISDLTQSLTGKAKKERHTSTHALSTQLESASQKLRAQQAAFALRTEELEARNKELEAQLVVSEEKLVAAGRREEAAKASGEERLKASAMGRDALQIRIRRLERELKGEKELRISLQSRSAAAKALWGKASDGVSSGALWSRLASAAAEQEQPQMESSIEEEQEEEAEEEEEEEPAAQHDAAAASTPSKPEMHVTSEIEVVSITTSFATPKPTEASSKTAVSGGAGGGGAGGGVLVSPLFESPGAPGEQLASPALATKGGGKRRDSLGSGIERLTAPRPRSALSLRRERSLADLDRAKAEAEAAAAEACSPKPRLQRRASTSAIKNPNRGGTCSGTASAARPSSGTAATIGAARSSSFMQDTAAARGRAVPKGQRKSSQQVQRRVALGVRVQGLETDTTVAPQFDRGGFPL